MNFDVWKFTVVIGLLPLISGIPHGRVTTKHETSKDHIKIVKRVEIVDAPNKDSSARAWRRQSLIHAGVDYGVKDIVDETASDDLESLGKITDFSGKVVKSTKKKKIEHGAQYKDTQASTKDIIERMRELQDNLFRRGGSKELAAKLKLMEPEIASATKAVKDVATGIGNVTQAAAASATEKRPKLDLSQFPMPAFPLVSNNVYSNFSAAQEAKSVNIAQSVMPSLIQAAQQALLNVKNSHTATAGAFATNAQTNAALLPPVKMTDVKVAPAPIQPTLTKELLNKNVPALPVRNFSPVSNQVTPQIASQSTIQNSFSQSLPSFAVVKEPAATEKAESRKIIPEDVVNKIIEKFQELKNEAKNFAILENGSGHSPSSPKKESHEAEAPKVESASSSPSSSSPSSSSPSSSTPSSSSPYATIGPAKDNEELRNLTSNSNSINSGSLQEGQVLQSPNLGPIVPAAPPPQQPMAMTPLSKSQPLPSSAYSSNAQTVSPSSQGNIPMMFIRTGQVLVPIFGNQGSSSAEPSSTLPQPPPQTTTAAPFINYPTTVPSDTSSGPSVPYPQPPPFGPPSDESPPVIPGLLPGSQPTNPATMSAQMSPFEPFSFPSSSGAQSASFPMGYPSSGVNQDPNSRCCIPGTSNPFPDSLRQNPQSSLFANQLPFLPASLAQPGPPGLVNTAMLNNLPAFPSVPNQMMGGVVNALPQTFGMPQPFSQNFFSSRNSPMAGGSRGMAEMPGEDGVPSSSFSKFGSPGDLPFMGSSPRGNLPFGLPNNTPPAANPWPVGRSETANNMDVMQKEKELEQAAMNDISDPVQGPPRFGNVSPDQLLDIADARSNLESINPDVGPHKTENRINPDALLDRIQGDELRGGLAGPGDPSKDLAHMRGISQAEPPNPFTGTTPDDLLDILSSKKRGSFGDHNRNLIPMSTNFLQRQQDPSLVFRGLSQNDELLSHSPRQYELQQVGTSGMQSVGSMPSGATSAGSKPIPFDPSVADIVEPKTSERNPSDLLSQFINQHHGPKRDSPVASDSMSKSVSVMSDDVLQFEHSRKAIDSDDVLAKYNQEQAETRHNIVRPENKQERKNRDSARHVRKTTIATKTLDADNVELRVNGQKLTDSRNLRSKIINGSTIVPHGKTLFTKGPIRVELSHSDDVDHTKVVNIVTSSKFNVTDSRRDRIRKP